MQTFLPYKDFNESAQSLDSKRLNKQILEGYQIINVLGNPDPKAAWRNHPAVLMWKHHEHALFSYLLAMIREANMRNIKTDKNEANILWVRERDVTRWGSGMPDWWKDKQELQRITNSHKANLFNKDPEYYDMFREYSADPCCDKCQYYWPTHERRNLAIA